MHLEEFYLDFLKKHKWQYIVYLFTLLYIPISKVGIPHFYGRLIGNINEKKVIPAFHILIVLIVLWFFTQTIHTISNKIHSRFMPKFVEFFRGRMIDNIFDKYSTNFEDLQIGDTMVKLIKSPWILEDVFDTIENVAFNNILTIVSSFIYLFMYNKLLGIVYVFSMICVTIFGYLFVEECSDTVQISENIYDRTHEEIEDTLSNLISIYTSNKVEHERGRIRVLSKQIYETQQKMLKCLGKYRINFTLVFVIVFAILNILSFTLFIKKQISLSTLSAIIIINYSLLTSFMGMYYQTKDIIYLKGCIEVFINYLNKLPKKNNVGVLDIPNPNKIRIDIKDLFFSYLPNKYILNGVNLTINPGENVALLGKIGSGKSTTAKLLIRLFDFDKGSIRFNGVDIKDISLENLRNHIRYIPQHPKLFNRTLYENIIYAVKEKVSVEHVLDLIKSLDIPEIYKTFKDKMNMSVGKNGSKLSGGQRQVVWLLRALLTKPGVIILDEPTASMDNKSKVEVTKLIKKIGENSTIILITHDEILLDYLDRKIMFKDGVIVEN